MARRQRSRAPQFTQAGKGAVRVTHRELIANMTGKDNLDPIDTIIINPSIETTFPWLSGIAQNYEQYRFLSLKFEFVSSAPADYGGNSYMAFDYDADDITESAQTSPIDLTTWEGCASASIWADTVVHVDPRRANARGPLYTRSEPVTPPKGTQNRLNDVGYLAFGAADVTHDTIPLAPGRSLGYIYASYTVELITPQTNPNQSTRVGVEHVDTLTPEVDAPWQGGFVPGSLDIINWLDGNNISIREIGTYLLELSGQGHTQPVADTVPLQAIEGCTLEDAPQTVEDWGSNALGFLQQWYLTVTDPTNIVRLTSLLNAVSAVTKFRTSITRVPWKDDLRMVKVKPQTARQRNVQLALLRAKCAEDRRRASQVPNHAGEHEENAPLTAAASYLPRSSVQSPPPPVPLQRH